MSRQDYTLYLARDGVYYTKAGDNFGCEVDIQLLGRRTVRRVWIAEIDREVCVTAYLVRIIRAPTCVGEVLWFTTQSNRCAGMFNRAYNYFQDHVFTLKSKLITMETQSHLWRWFDPVFVAQEDNFACI